MNNLAEDSITKLLSLGNCFKTEGTKALAGLLRYSSFICFDIGFCNISPGAMGTLVDAANSCRTLRWICVEGNPELEAKEFPFRVDLEVKY